MSTIPKWKFEYGFVPSGIQKIDTYYVFPYMYELAIVSNAQDILEIGTGTYGTSTFLFLKACEKTGGRVVSIDINGGCANWWKFSYYNIKEKPSNWTFINSDSKTAVVEGTFDIILHDSSHQENDTRIELEKYVPLIRDNGYLLMHDFEFIGVYKPTHEYLDRHPELKLEFVIDHKHDHGFLGVLKKYGR